MNLSNVKISSRIISWSAMIFLDYQSFIRFDRHNEVD